jgi:hypothetical protein
MADNSVPEFRFSGFKPVAESPRSTPLTAETERIVEQLRAQKKAFELLFDAHGVHPSVATVMGAAISRLCFLDVQLQRSKS